ncbi:hypothetical protein Q1695_008639 [Nippostrongylus brasiliensis]|nr:hypothetical protein Q1695_008639 [Nippostrongylus brasiliensis]
MSSSEADSLRRSKRNKFHLDVAAMHLAHPERRRTQPGRLTPSPEVPTRRASSMSPNAHDSPVSSENSEERSKRVRRVPAKNASYVFDDSDDDDCRRGLEGTNLCVKCPARFETRPGLANHFKLHFGEKRKFACDLCDFSATTAKSLRFHRRVHDRYGVGPAATTDSPPDGITIDELQCEISPMEAGANSSPPQLSPPAAFNLSRSHTEPGRLSAMSTQAVTPPLCRRPAPAPPMTPPPNLVRAMNSNVMLNRAFHEKPRKCIQCPYKAKNGDRMKTHMIGHQKRFGFQCPFCTFKSESAGFLKRHVEIHGSRSYAWPPVYVGVNPRKTAPEPVGKKAQCRSTMKVLFLRCASQHTPSGSSMRWPCPMNNCKFSAAVVPQHVTHHIRRHVNEKFRRLPQHLCLRCGVCLRSSGALRIHRIIHHTRHHHPKAIQYFMRERVGYDYIRCFTKPKFEVKEEEVEEKPKPVVCDLKEQLVIPAVSPAVIGDRILAQQISIITDSTPEKPKTNEFCCNLCPYGASTRSNLIRHEAKHQIKDLFKCPHCTFSGRTLEFIEKHRRLHQTVAAISTSTASPSSPQIHMPPMVLVPVSTVPPSLVSLPHSAAPLITVSLPARGQITMAANNRLPLTFASVIQDQSVIPSIPSTPPSVKVDEDSAASTPTEQKPKCPPRRSATEPSLRFIGSDGVKRRRCPLCPYVSKFSCDMRSHMEMHTMNARFKCSQCSYSTKRAVSLRSHIALHTEENAIKARNGKAINIVVQKILIGAKRGRGAGGFYSCAHCPFVTRICAELWRHARRHLGTSRRFNCSLCSFSSVCLDVMEEHQLLHPEGVAFIRERNDLFQQQTSADEDCPTTPATPSTVELKCDVCPFKTNIYQRMWNHKQKHKKMSKYVCSKCSFSTGSELCLEDHMVVHSEPGSAVDTGTVPSRSQSTDGTRKSGSDEVETPDSQKIAMMDESTTSVDEAVNSSSAEAEAKPETPDVSLPLSIKIKSALALMRPAKEVLPVLKRDQRNEARYQCPDCPFADCDEMIFNLHREMHGGRTRAFACNLCNYSCFAPETLHRHLSMHLPSLSPASMVAQKKRGLSRRAFQTSDPIPLGAKHFSCNQCSFRTVSETNFVEHRQQHAQHIQQRLVTQMKRAASQAEEDIKRYSKIKRVAKKSDKQHACVRCAFHCDTATAFSRHLEMHTQRAIFKCRICDYSANTKNIVDFHEQNHHLDQSLTQLRRNAILAPDIVRLAVTASDDERARIAGQELRCKRCQFHTLEVSAFAKHWEQSHCETKADRDFAADLRMSLVPANSILTTA